MKIGELAKLTGCKVVTIRYYEKEGLLAEPERTEGNYRSYGADDRERLEFIMHCRKHSMKLGEIRKLLAFRDHPQKDCSWVGELVGAHIADVDEQIQSLQHLKFHLETLRHRCKGENEDGCGIIRTLSNRAGCCERCERCASEEAHGISLAGKA